MIAALVLLFSVQTIVTPTPMPRPAPSPAPISILRHAGSQEARPQGKSLAEVAKTLKLKMTPGARVLDNESVKALAEGVELTTAKPLPTSRGGTALPGRSNVDASKRTFWQQKYQSARSRVTFLEAEVARLDNLVKDLQRKFYAWDDPAYRDGVLKPDWDKALVDLRTAQEQLEVVRSEPDRVMDEAHADGALPGWFRGLPEPSADEGKPTAPSPRPIPTFAPDF